MKASLGRWWPSFWAASTLLLLGFQLQATTIMVWWQKDQVIIAADGVTQHTDVLLQTTLIPECKIRILSNGLVFFASGKYRSGEITSGMRDAGLGHFDAYLEAEAAAQSATSAHDTAERYSERILPYFRAFRDDSKDKFNSAEKMASQTARQTFCFVGRSPLGELNADCRNVMFYRDSRKVAIAPHDSDIHSESPRTVLTNPLPTEGVFEVIGNYESSPRPLTIGTAHDAERINSIYREGWDTSADHGFSDLDRVTWLINREIQIGTLNAHKLDDRFPNEAPHIPTVGGTPSILVINTRSGEYRFTSRPAGCTVDQVSGQLPITDRNIFLAIHDWQWLSVCVALLMALTLWRRQRLKHNNARRE